jgi:hypothetical protein
VGLADLVRVPQGRPCLGDTAPAAQPRAVFEQQASPVERPAHQVRLEGTAEFLLDGLRSGLRSGFLSGQQRGRVEQRDPRPRGHAVAPGRPERRQELTRLVPAAGPHGGFGQVAEGPGALHVLVGRIGTVEHPAELTERLLVAPGADRRDAADELDAAQPRADPRGEHHDLGLPSQLLGERGVAAQARGQRLPDQRRGLVQRLAGQRDRVPRLLGQQARQGREPGLVRGDRRRGQVPGLAPRLHVQHLGERGVRPPPQLRAGRLVDRRAHQRMLERHPGLRHGQDPRVHRGMQRTGAARPGHRQRDRGGDLGEVVAVGGGRHHRRDAGRRAQPAQPGGEAVLQPGGERNADGGTVTGSRASSRAGSRTSGRAGGRAIGRAGAVGGSARARGERQLGQRQRVAGRMLEDPRALPRIQARVPDQDHPLRLVRAERAQHHDGHVRLDEHVLEAVADRGQQRDRHGGDPARHEPQDPEGGVVHPVQVVGGHEQPAAARRPGHQLERRDRGREHIRCRAVGMTERGPQHLPRPGREQLEGASQGVEQLVQPGVRDPGLGRHPGGPQDGAAIAGGQVRGRVQQRRLARARLADEQQAATAGTAEHPRDRGQLTVAADQPGHPSTGHPSTGHLSIGRSLPGHREPPSGYTDRSIYR